MSFLLQSNLSDKLSPPHDNTSRALFSVITKGSRPPLSLSHLLPFLFSCQLLLSVAVGQCSRDIFLCVQINLNASSSREWECAHCFVILFFFWRCERKSNWFLHILYFFFLAFFLLFLFSSFFDCTHFYFLTRLNVSLPITECCVPASARLFGRNLKVPTAQ